MSNKYELRSQDIANNLLRLQDIQPIIFRDSPYYPLAPSTIDFSPYDGKLEVVENYTHINRQESNPMLAKPDLLAGLGVNPYEYHIAGVKNGDDPTVLLPNSRWVVDGFSGVDKAQRKMDAADWISEIIKLEEIEDLDNGMAIGVINAIGREVYRRKYPQFELYPDTTSTLERSI